MGNNCGKLSLNHFEEEITPLFMFPTNRMDIPRFPLVNKSKGVMADSVSSPVQLYNFLEEAIAEGKIVPVAFERCPLCCENRSFLLCHSCVNNGSFTHTQRDSEKFHELRARWESKEAEREKSNRRFELQIDDIERANAKRSEIESLKRKIYLIKRSIVESRAKCDADKRQLKDDKSRRRQRRAFLEQPCQHAMSRMVQRISSLEMKSPSQIPTYSKQTEGTSIDPKSINDIRSSHAIVHQDLCRKRSVFINNLRKHIFSVEEVPAISEVDNLAMSMATALKDACETAFIGGRWVHTDHRGENHYQIVRSTLPDYSGENCGVNLYVMSVNHGSDKPAEIRVGNPSFGIQAAIGYAAMLANLMSTAVDIPLPRKCSFRELCDELNEQDFSNFVWRLHENIMHLAASQGVHQQDLLNHLSLHNILAIFQAKSLGRDGPFVPAYNLTVSADLCPLEYNCDTDTSMTDMDLSRDWERVPVGIPSFETNSLPLGVSVPVDTSTAGALMNNVSNAASSLASWWRSYYN